MHIKPEHQQPFHWNYEKGEKTVCVKVITGEQNRDEYEWSCDFSLAEQGSFTVHNRESTLEVKEKKTDDVKKQKSFMERLIGSKEEEVKQPDFLLPTARAKKRFLRINRKYHQHQMFILIEEEDIELPTMKIENKCSDISLIFQQVENKQAKEIDICDPRQSQTISWSDPKGAFQLQMAFYEGYYLLEEPNVGQSKNCRL